MALVFFLGVQNLTPVGCKKGTCESLSQIKDKKIMFSLAQVTEVAESKAAGTHVSNATFEK